MNSGIKKVVGMVGMVGCVASLSTANLPTATYREDRVGEFKVSYDRYSYSSKFTSEPVRGVGAQQYSFEADLEGTLNGVTLYYTPLPWIPSLELSIGYREGDMDGTVDYYVTQAQSYGDIKELDFRARYIIETNSKLTPFLNMGYLWRETKRVDTVPVGWLFGATGTRNSHVTTEGHYFTLGGGGMYAYPMMNDKFAIGARLEGNGLLGFQNVETDGSSAEDGIFGLNGMATLFADYSVIRGGSIFVEGGVLGHLWWSGSGDMEETQTGYYGRVGLRYAF